MSNDHLTPPRQYGDAGHALWTEVTTGLEADGAALDVLERQHLDGACRLADHAARIEDALEADPDLIVAGSRNQPIANPLVTELRQYVAQIATNLARVKLPAEQAERVPRSVAGRVAAQKRWGTA